VSLRLRDEHRIVLHPGRIVLARIRRELSRHGLKRHVQALRELPCETTAAGELPWSGALRVLETALPELSGGKSYTSVVLSNHFMRYALVPWSDELKDAKEEVAYAQHSFNELYGRDAGERELRISPAGGCMPQMASAVDKRLLGALREVLGRSGIDLKSIQPHLMQAYNSCHAALRDCSAWLALVEHGNLCLALLQRGRWSWVRSMRIGDHWHEELPRLLEREAFNANIETATDDVLLWAPEHDESLPVASGRWKIRLLQPARMPGLDAGIASRFAMYMSE
jgi:hypothetical protein